MGTQLGLLYTGYSNRGNMEVYIDGILEGTINQYSSTTTWQNAWYSPVWTDKDTHTIRLVHASGAINDLDAVIITDSTATATPTAPPTATVTGTLTVSVTPGTTPIPTETPPPPLQSAIYSYDGDGNMVKAVVNDVVTYYPGRHYNEEVDGSISTVKKFYTMGSTTVAVRTVSGTEDVLNWIFGDHLGSASVTANADGSWNSELKYTAFGEVRASSGLTPTEYRYTNQRYENSFGLYFYVARWYDSELGHFIQADTLVPEPGLVISLDRYAYVHWNPIRYNDPSGHNRDFGMGDQYNEPGWWGIIKNGERVGRTKDEKFSADVSLFIEDLAEQGIDVEVKQSARNPHLAHQWSTAYNIFIGNISIDDLRLNPIDMDGNVWFSEEWDNGNDRELERKVKVNAWEKGVPSCFKSFWIICIGPQLVYALEGYSPGDSRRTPNMSNVPISNHVVGLAVDLSWEGVEDSVIAETAAKHDLFRPLLNFKESPENWHFEPIKTR